MSVLIWAIYIAGGLVLLLLLICITKLTVHIDLKHAKDNDHFKVTLKAWFNLITYTIDIPLVKVDPEDASIIVKEEKKMGNQDASKISGDTKKITPTKIINNIKKVKELLNHVVGFHRIIRRFFSHIHITDLEWKSGVGVGDASHTGMIVGGLWTVKGSMVGLVSHYMKLKAKPNISITPYFQHLYSETHLTCMISFRIGYAIGAVLRILKYWKHHVKGGKHHVRTSNSGLNDNGYGKFKAND